MNSHIFTAIVTLCLSTLCTVTSTPLYAAKAPLSPEALKKEATHIITGKVVELDIRTEHSTIEGLGSFEHIILTKIKVKKVEKGDDVEPDDEIVVRSFRRKATLAVAQGASVFGHSSIPKKDVSVRVYLERKGETYYVLNPNGFQPIDEDHRIETNDVLQLWRGFTFLFPLEVWILVFLLTISLLPVLGLLLPKNYRGRSIKFVLALTIGFWAVGLTSAAYHFFVATREFASISLVVFGFATILPIAGLAISLFVGAFRKSPRKVETKEATSTTPG